MELSIEQKAKRYDEAIEIAKKINNEQQTQPFNIMTRVFPELKESEDERIRNEIILYIGARNDISLDIHNKWLSWLEKQGENSVCKVKIGETYKCIASPRYTCFRTGDIYHIEDNFIAELINICSGCFVLLEKQGEQKSQGKSALEAIKEKEVDNANKVEPKFNFKVGQWIVATGKCVYLIAKIDGLNVTLIDTNGYVFDVSSLNDVHEWTIQDAEDGDILSDGITIFIFEDLLSDGSVTSYCDYNTSYDFCPLSMNLCGKFSPATKEQRELLFSKMKEAGYEWDNEKKELKKIEQNNQFTPEEASILDKHIDKFLEQNLTWSEEDENRLSWVIKYFNPSGELYSNLIYWLKSLKDRIQSQSWWKLSDEDKLRVGQAIMYLSKKLSFENEKDDYNFREGQIKWLKSLEQRIGWKPSDEQMKALHYLNLTGNISYAGQGQALIDLFNSLKELT